MIPQKEALFWEFQAMLDKAKAWWQAHGRDMCHRWNFEVCTVHMYEISSSVSQMCKRVGVA